MHWILACVAGAGAGYGHRRALTAYEEREERERELREQDLDRMTEVPEWQAPESRDRFGDVPSRPRRRAEVHADGSMSFVESATQAATQALSSIGVTVGSTEDNPELPAGEGAPPDGYEKCAMHGEMCSCDEGEIRMGSGETMSFTHPVMVGELKEVECTRAGLGKVQFASPEDDGVPDPACFCNDRFVHVQVDLGGQGQTSFAEADGDTATDAGKLCLVQKASEGSSLAQERDAEQRAVDRALLLDASTASSSFHAALVGCETVDEKDKTWIYMLGTGQIKNKDSGACLTAVFPTTPQQPIGGEQRKLVVKACTLEDSQVESQRWEVPFYLGGDGGFDYGSGKIKLAYGAHGFHSLCLSTDETHLLLDDCNTEGGPTEFAMSAVGGAKHTWEVCAEPGATCDCYGDVKYGSSDAKEYSSEVSMQDPGKGSITCAPADLQAKSLFDPGSDESIECQCRHDAFMDGEGSALDAAAKKMKDEKPGEGSSLAPVIGGVAFVVLFGGGFYMYKRKQAWAALEGEEEEEYEEEEEEEEYEE